MESELEGSWLKPIGTWPGLVIQPSCKAPSDLQVENVKRID